MKYFAACIFTLFLTLACVFPALAQKRVALVIGNAAYKNKIGPLQNPHNDIALVAKSLRAVGFEVMKPVRDATRSTILLAIYRFTAKLKAAGPDAVGFFYYAGHGIASNGSNYLIPVDVDSTKGWVLDVKGVKLDEITALLRNRARNANHFVVFDACRNKLRGSRGSRGFVPVRDRSGMLIAFSTSPGATADDGDGRQGPYAAALATELLKPGQDHLHLFQRVKLKVYKSTGGQVPWERNGLLDLVYLGGKKKPDEKKRQPATTLSEAAQEWRSLQRSTDKGDLEAYITQFGKHFPYYGRKAKKRLRKLKEQKVAVGVFPPQRPVQNRRLTPGTIFDDCNGASWCPSMIVVPKGSFLMGSKKGDKDERPVHRVTLAKRFAVGRFEITRGEFGAFVKATGHNVGNECYVFAGSKWKRKKGRNYRKAGFSQTDEHPVVCMNWNDAKAYVKWLNKKTGGKPYRLLSEAEWEYVARAGTKGPFSWSGKASTAKANYDGNHTYGGSSKGKYRKKTVSVDSFKANAFGLYNVHGNAWEWVEDCYKDNYKGAPTDGSVRTAGSCNKHVLRGGSWDTDPSGLRSTNRDWNNSSDRYYLYGFRIARSLPLPRTR